MTDINLAFLNAYIAFDNRTVYTKRLPAEMLASAVDSYGWCTCKPLPGTLQQSDYTAVETRFGVKFPQSFINWHKSYFFCGGDCSLLRLPESLPTQPLKAIISQIDWYIPQQLIPQKLYPFADEGNDGGVLVFDARQAVADGEFAIRFYDRDYGGNLAGLSAVIFSSFTKLLECIIHYLTELKTRKNFDIIPDFFIIDPTGAGKTGRDYWLGWAGMQQANFEAFGN